MSYGELCASKVWVSDGGTNSIAGHWRCCGQYVDHDGPHRASLHCVRNTTYGGEPGYANRVIGSIQWEDDLAGKQPTALSRKPK